MPDETEITNKVLETKLDGFKELTEIKFKNIEQSLIRIENNIQGFVTRIELEDTKKDFNKIIQDIKQGFMQHNIDDKESFGGLSKGQLELRDVVKFWGGVVAIIAIILPIVLELLLRYVFKG